MTKQIKEGWEEVVLEDGSGPYYECGYCEGHGRIEIDGKRHMEIKRENIALRAIEYFKPIKEEWSVDELQELGQKIQRLLSTPTSEEEK